MHDKEFMRRALDLAALWQGKTSPNPCVGAVVVKKGKIVGEGAHPGAGKMHAEVLALNMAGAKARGATIYVTLEPCNHIGRTGPCTKAILNAGILRVVFGATDINSVASGGAAWLHSQGLDVKGGLLSKECEQLNVPFLSVIKRKRPYVIAKWAMTADGKLATSSGSSKWISGEKSRAVVQELRGRIDAILVGAGTVLKDNPSLRSRAPGVVRQPTPVILDHHRQIKESARLFSQHKESFVYHEKRISLILEDLAENNIQSVLVEGGSSVLGAFFDAKLVDEVFVFIAPKICGGGGALSPVGGAGRHLMSHAIDLKGSTWRPYGPDMLLHGWLGDGERWQVCEQLFTS